MFLFSPVSLQINFPSGSKARLFKVSLLEKDLYSLKYNPGVMNINILKKLFCTSFYF
ncbi:hypothetical protein BH23BAC1_BH23BAC1_47750 [soil metagenome]